MTNYMSRTQWDARIAKVRQGMTATEIADLEGVGVSAICIWARRNNIALVKGSRGPCPRDADFQPLYDAGFTSRQAAAAVGCSLEVARYWARQTGQPWPRAAPKPPKQPRKTIFSGLTEQQRADALVLMRKGGYSRREAAAIVTKEKEKI